MSVDGAEYFVARDGPEEFLCRLTKEGKRQISVLLRGRSIITHELKSGAVFIEVNNGPDSGLYRLSEHGTDKIQGLAGGGQMLGKESIKLFEENGAFYVSEDSLLYVIRGTTAFSLGIAGREIAVLPGTGKVVCLDDGDLKVLALDPLELISANPGPMPDARQFRELNGDEIYRLLSNLARYDWSRAELDSVAGMLPFMDGETVRRFSVEQQVALRAVFLDIGLAEMSWLGRFFNTLSRVSLADNRFRNVADRWLSLAASDRNRALALAKELRDSGRELSDKTSKEEIPENKFLLSCLRGELELMPLASNRGTPIGGRSTGVRWSGWLSSLAGARLNTGLVSGEDAGRLSVADVASVFGPEHSGYPSTDEMIRAQGMGPGYEFVRENVQNGVKASLSANPDKDALIDVNIHVEERKGASTLTVSSRDYGKGMDVHDILAFLLPMDRTSAIEGDNISQGFYGRGWYKNLANATGVRMISGKKGSGTFRILEAERQDDGKGGARWFVTRFEEFVGEFEGTEMQTMTDYPGSLEMNRIRLELEAAVMADALALHVGALGALSGNAKSRARIVLNGKSIDETIEEEAAVEWAPGERIRVVRRSSGRTGVTHGGYFLMDIDQYPAMWAKVPPDLRKIFEDERLTLELPAGDRIHELSIIPDRERGGLARVDRALLERLQNAVLYAVMQAAARNLYFDRAVDYAYRPKHLMRGPGYDVLSLADRLNRGGWKELSDADAVLIQNPEKRSGLLPHLEVLAPEVTGGTGQKKTVSLQEARQKILELASQELRNASGIEQLLKSFPPRFWALVWEVFSDPTARQMAAEKGEDDVWTELSETKWTEAHHKLAELIENIMTPLSLQRNGMRYEIGFGSAKFNRAAMMRVKHKSLGASVCWISLRDDNPAVAWMARYLEGKTTPQEDYKALFQILELVVHEDTHIWERTDENTHNDQFVERQRATALEMIGLRIVPENILRNLGSARSEARTQPKTERAKMGFREGDIFNEPAMDRALVIGEGVLSQTEKFIVYGDKTYVVWYKGPQKGRVYRVLEKPSFKDLNSVPSLAQILDHIDSALKRMNDRVTQPIIDSELIELLVYIHQLNNGEQGRLGLKDVRYYDSGLNEFVRALQEKGLKVWLQEQARRKEYKNVNIMEETIIEHDALNLYYYGIVPTAGNTYFNAKYRVWGTHATYDAVLTDIINERALVSGGARDEGIKKKTGEGYGSYDGAVVSFWSFPDGNVFIKGRNGSDRGLGSPIVFGVSESTAKKLEGLTETIDVRGRVMRIKKVRDGTMSGEKTIRGRVPLEDISCVFVPYFKAKDVKRILVMHGFGHIEVLPLGFINNKPVWKPTSTAVHADPSSSSGKTRSEVSSPRENGEIVYVNQSAFDRFISINPSGLIFALLGLPIVLVSNWGNIAPNIQLGFHAFLNWYLYVPFLLTPFRILKGIKNQQPIGDTRPLFHLFSALISPFGEEVEHRGIILNGTAWFLGLFSILHASLYGLPLYAILSIAVNAFSFFFDHKKQKNLIHFYFGIAYASMYYQTHSLIVCSLIVPMTAHVLANLLATFSDVLSFKVASFILRHQTNARSEARGIEEASQTIKYLKSASIDKIEGRFVREGFRKFRRDLYRKDATFYLWGVDQTGKENYLSIEVPSIKQLIALLDQGLTWVERKTLESGNIHGDLYFHQKDLERIKAFFADTSKKKTTKTRAPLEFPIDLGDGLEVQSSEGMTSDTKAELFDRLKQLYEEHTSGYGIAYLNLKNHENSDVLYITDHEEIVGFSVYEPGGRQGWLLRLQFTANSLRRRGIGTKVALYLLMHLKLKGLFSRLTSTTLTGSERNLREERELGNRGDKRDVKGTGYGLWMSLEDKTKYTFIREGNQSRPPLGEGFLSVSDKKLIDDYNNGDLRESFVFCDLPDVKLLEQWIARFARSQKPVQPVSRKRPHGSIATRFAVSVAHALRPGSPKTLGLPEAQKVVGYVLQGKTEDVLGWVREAAIAEIRRKSTESSGLPTQINEMTAEIGIQAFISALEAIRIKGNLTIGFDVLIGKNFLEALKKVGAPIGTVVITKEMARKMPPEIFKTMNFGPPVKDFKSYKPSLAAENPKAVPVLSKDLVADYFSNPALFGVGVENTGNTEGGPFYEEFEYVVRIFAGILRAQGLTFEEINARLMEILFKLDAGSERSVLSLNGRHLVVHREALQQIMLEYQTTSKVEKAA